jgi:hypothetical protein
MGRERCNIMATVGAIVVESLVAESADVVTIAEFFSEEIQDVLDTEQANASVITFLTQLKAVADAIANQFS